jgi:hypothetical protein
MKINWDKEASKLLLGRKIVEVRYMTDDEAADSGFEERSVQITLDNGLIIYPSRDDEGNGAGALFTTDPKTPVLPVLR